VKTVENGKKRTINGRKTMNKRWKTVDAVNQQSLHRREPLHGMLKPASALCCSAPQRVAGLDRREVPVAFQRGFGCASSPGHPKPQGSKPVLSQHSSHRHYPRYTGPISRLKIVPRAISIHFLNGWQWTTAKKLGAQDYEPPRIQRALQHLAQEKARPGAG
jgi:hypothetical protein